MTAIRNLNTNVPHVFRYPLWASDVFYPAGSVVSVYVASILDSETRYLNFYTNIRDAKPGDDSPTSNSNWKLTFDAQQAASDSEFLVKFDNLDSDLQNAIISYQNSDSDIKKIIQLMKDQSRDSDNIVSWGDLDSEKAKLAHDFRAADSEIRKLTTGGLDSEIRARKNADSDIRASILPTIGSITKDITGFVDRTSSLLSFDNFSREVVLAEAVAGQGWTMYHKGTMYKQIGSTAIVIDPTSGGRYIKWNPSTKFLEETQYPNFLEDILVAYIYWDTLTSTAIVFGDERHSVYRDTSWHRAHHLEQGAAWISGGGVSATLDNASKVTFAVSTPLVIHDEDIDHTITHSTTPSAYQQILDVVAKVPVLYVNGNSTFTQAFTSSTKDSDGPWLFGPNHAYYNPVVNNVGALVEVTGAKEYFNCWLIATNDSRYPVKLLLGQEVFSNANQAGQETFAHFDLPLPEFVPMYKFTLRYSNTYTQNRAKIRITNLDIITSRASAVNTSFNTSNHNLLTGRTLDDQHPISAITGLEARLKSLENFDSDSQTQQAYDYGLF